MKKEDSEFQFLQVLRRSTLLWFGAFGICITALSNKEHFLHISSWLHYLVYHWNCFLSSVAEVIGNFVGFSVPVVFLKILVIATSVVSLYLRAFYNEGRRVVLLRTFEDKFRYNLRFSAYGLSICCTGAVVSGAPVLGTLIILVFCFILLSIFVWFRSKWIKTAEYVYRFPFLEVLAPVWILLGLTWVMAQTSLLETLFGPPPIIS